MFKKIITKTSVFFRQNKKLAAVILLLLIITGVAAGKKISTNKAAPIYQTATVEKGTLTVIVTASGQVSAANSAEVSTEASGVVSQIYVENGQVIKAGDQIAEIELDLEGQQRSTQAWASYQSAKNNLESAKTSYYTLRSDMLTKWDDYMDTAQNSTYENADGSPKTDTRQWPEFVSINDDWLATEAKYKNQENVVKQAQSSLASAWLSYQQSSSTIYAPISGTVTGLSLQIGSVLTAQSNTSGTATAQKIAAVQTGASPTIQFNLTQIDTPKVKVGNQATLTFDAFPNKTFTGKVVSIDTIGSVSSGVTTYPATIKLDTEVPEIFPNMTASANIITQVKDDFLLVPANAVQIQQEQTTVRLLKNGQTEYVNVEIGLSSGTQTEILSGLAEGDTVITGAAASGSSSQSQNSQTKSVFGGSGGFMGGGPR